MGRRWAAGLSLAAALLAACQPAGGAPANWSTAGLKVVATFSILGDWVKTVAGPETAVFVLVGPGGDTHAFEPNPADSQRLAEADLIFENGLGFETWLDDLYTSSGSTAQRVVVTQGLQTDRLTAGPEAGEVDPHAWQDVSAAIQMVGLIRDALSARDPDQAERYRANAAAYLQQLRELDTALEQQAQTLPPERRRLVTNHDALGYFARRYGFQIIGNLLGSLSTEAGEPSAASLAQMAEAIRAAGVPAVFTENIENAKVIAQVAAEVGVQVAPPLYTDALGPPGSPGESYLKMMRYNMDTIVAALR